MSRINLVNYESTNGKSRELLEAVNAQLGFVPNLMKTMAQSPAVLEAALNFSSTVGRTLNAKLREQIAVLTAEANGCGYCLSAHTAAGKMSGLTEEELLAARAGNSNDTITDAALKFAKAVLEKRGNVTDEDLKAVRDAGFSDGGVAEIVAHVALNIFTNYFNQVAQTEIDFPIVEVPLRRSAQA